MTPLITIMMIYVGADAYSVTYPSQMACGEALVIIAESDEGFMTRKTWAHCVRTYAPSASLRPRARGDL